MGLKFNRKDSLANSVFDVFFVALGGLLAWFLPVAGNAAVAALTAPVLLILYRRVGVPRTYPRFETKGHDESSGARDLVEAPLDARDAVPAREGLEGLERLEGLEGPEGADEVNMPEVVVR